jgi:hypothetical protein
MPKSKAIPPGFGQAGFVRRKKLCFSKTSGFEDAKNWRVRADPTYGQAA